MMTSQEAVSAAEHGQTLQVPQYTFPANYPRSKQRPAHSPTLALPPSTQSSPSLPTPPLRRRASAINAWAALVQPGSPAPRSPHRRPSASSSRRSSTLCRRPSLSRTRTPSDSFANVITTPRTASIQDIDINLSALGYTSVFVHLPPKTPWSACSDLQSPRPTMSKPPTQVQPPSPKKPTGTKKIFKRFRSLGLLRPHSKPPLSSSPQPLPSPVRVAPLPSPTKITARRASMRKMRTDPIARRKRAKYAHLLGRGGGGGGGGGAGRGHAASKHVRPPPMLASEIALMQFMDGGSLESNVRRMMERQARAAAADGSHQAEWAVGDVYRDDRGGLWWDKEEEMEYRHLLGGEDECGDVDRAQWVKFGEEGQDIEGVLKTGLMDLVTDGVQDTKRESVSTQDSDLDMRYIVLPADETRCGTESNSPQIGKFQTGLNILSVPSRPQRKARHLMKSELFIDLAAFAPRSPGRQVHRISPKSPLFQKSPRTPKSARFSSTFVLSSSPSLTNSGISTPTLGEKRQKKIRRRPAPLKLHAASYPSMWRRVDVSPMVMAAEGRKEFVEASFIPQSGAAPSRRKIVYASLDPVDDEEDEESHAALMRVFATNDIDISLSKCTGSAARRKRSALRGLSQRT